MKTIFFNKLNIGFGGIFGSIEVTSFSEPRREGFGGGKISFFGHL